MPTKITNKQVKKRKTTKQDYERVECETYRFFYKKNISYIYLNFKKESESYYHFTEDDDDEEDEEEEKAPGDKPAATDDDEEDSEEDDDEEEADDDDDDDDEDDDSEEGGAPGTDGEKDAENDDEDSDEFVLFGDDLFDDLFEDDDDNKKSSSTAKPVVEVASVSSNPLPAANIIPEAVISAPQKVSAVVATEDADKLEAEQPVVELATDEKPQPLPIDANDDNSIEDDSIFVSDDTPVIDAEKNTLTNGDVFYDESGAEGNGKPFKNDKDMETLTALQQSTVKPELIKATKKAATKAKKPAKEEDGEGGILDIVDTLISDEEDDDDDDEVYIFSDKLFKLEILFVFFFF